MMLWVALYPLLFMREILNLMAIDDMNFKLVLVGFAAVNFVAAFLLETSLDHGFFNCLRKLRRKKESKKAYKRLELQLQTQLSWPPLNQTLYPSRDKLPR
uniref:Uncharacterized protein n=3 Tax=Pyxicephalus adspersus TaxID=30357 RepID=A0AAV2ZK77_PYXAD|nr:TPA: hypothetical protein GDO54_003158 [Pyxicephalus adspersus]